ncbi:conserved membrane hypothetical protein [Candidatus Sulfotelmatobacter kueseliae]|uniref:Membrane protein 6-pyruvoyl-tetrahydropterin synthase-related domain-containing protein n=1 Tax=Candidatus Sulfotelmatobacter kueseliae TaxID=2042962 RepID=A0A2U3JXJ3_9BACT|nr:conserved membrane hypothetical protein [Candidatus Sulfotelmatobacter kueseliae]
MSDTGTSANTNDSLSGKPQGENRGAAQRPRWASLLGIALAAVAVEIPFFFNGMPSGHDVEFHLYSWLEVLSQWKLGVFFPRWAAWANLGYGEPRFLFYPPASWMLGSLISAVFPWRLAAAVYIWSVLVLAGASMFLLVRRWFDRRDAIFAAALYAVNPYHLVVVYWRSAFAELLASCLVPLLLLLVLKAAEEGWRVLVPLSLLLAAAWLTNAPAAVMIHYSLALLVLILAWQRRSLRLLLIGASAVALGACLSAFYLFPAIYEQKWINIAEAISSGSRPQDNFLFIHTTDPDHDAFNRIISWVAVLEIAVVLTAAWAAKAWRAKNRQLWNALFVWAATSSVLMFPLTALLWKFLPKLVFMQFPWRWLLCLSLMFSIFLTVGVRRWWVRTAICVVTIAIIVVAWQRIQPPWWDNVADLREMQDNMSDGIGYEGVDEYTPVGADPSTIDKDVPQVAVDGAARATIQVLHWGPEFKLFTAEMSAPDQLALHLFRYPAWQAQVNGRVVETAARPDTGQMLVPVAAGMNRVQVILLRTWDRTVGGWTSLIAAVSIGIWALLVSRRRRTSDLGPQVSKSAV